MTTTTMQMLGLKIYLYLLLRCLLPSDWIQEQSRPKRNICIIIQTGGRDQYSTFKIDSSSSLLHAFFRSNDRSQ
jgi:hypothetical protein